MSNRLTIFLLVILLVGCGSTSREVDSEIPESHPSIPRPVMIHNPDWQIIEEDGQVYVASEYSSFLDFMVYQEDLGRYIKQVISTMCYYRRDLNEQFCQKSDLQTE